jgi:hypothetical protein
MLTEWEFRKRAQVLDYLRQGRIIVFRSDAFPNREGVARKVRKGIKYRLFEKEGGLRFLIYERIVTENDIWELMDCEWKPSLGTLRDYVRRR